MYDYNEIDETQSPDFWTKDHYEDEPEHPLNGKSAKNYEPVCYARTGPPLPVPDSFHQVKAERLQSYGRANGHQKLWIKNSLILLAGPPKIGKTTIAVALGKAIAQGKPFGGFPLEKQSVGYLSYDDSPGEILATIDRHPDITANTNFYLNIEAQPIDTPQGLEAIENFLIKQRGNGIVIIDSFHAAIRKSQTRDARAIRKLITPLKRVAERAGTIILIHHTDAHGKRAADHTQIQAAVSQTILMSTQEHDGYRLIKLQCKGRGTGSYRKVHLLSRRETHYQTHNLASNLHARDHSTKPILKALEKCPRTVKELIELTNLDNRVIYKRLKRLKALGFVTSANTYPIKFKLA
jgi:RecA-family ATPase